MTWKKLLGAGIVLAFFALVWGIMAVCFGSGLLAAAVLLAVVGIAMLAAVAIFWLGGDDE